MGRCSVETKGPMKCVVCASGISRGNFVKCPMCGLVQAVPMPTVNEIAALYHEDMDHFEPYLDQIDVHKEYFRNILKGIKKNAMLLDIGCAMGALLIEAKKKGIEAMGVDISRDAVAYCRKQGLDVSDKWPNKKFDVVTAFQVIEHERDPLGFMKRVQTLLKKGGLVILATPNYGGFWRKVMGKHWFGFAHPEHVVLLDFTSMRNLLEKAGFHNIEIRADSPRPFPLSFAIKRAADYFPVLRFLLLPLGNFFNKFNIINPINPWDDMIVYAKK